MGKAKNAIVTGASRGIGKAIAEEFSFRGYNVALVSRNYPGVEGVSDYLRKKYDNNCLPYECDVGEGDRVMEVFREVNEDLRGIDVLVNNAGVNSRKILDTKNLK